MARFNHPDKFLITQFGGFEELEISYFTCTGVFIHFWGLLEWKVCETILENIFEKIIQQRLGSWSREKKHKMLTEILRGSNVNVHAIKNVDDMGGKLELVELIIGDGSFSGRVTGGPKVLRDIIAHDSMSLQVHMGAFQPSHGWIKKYPDRAETREYNEIIKNRKVQLGESVDDYREALMFDTYSEKEIKDHILVLVDLILLLGEDMDSHNVYKKLRKESILRSLDVR